MVKRYWLLLCLLGLLASVGRAAERDTRSNLLSNGDFAKDGGNGWPADWPHPDGATWEQEGEQRFLRLSSLKPGQMILVYRLLPLPSPPPPALEVSLRVRYADIQAGEKAWHDGRVMFHFKNQAGEVLKPGPDAPYFRGTSKGWVETKVVLKVPAGAHSLELMPCLFQVARGTLDFGEIRVLPAQADQLPPAPAMILSATVEPKNPAALPAELHVAGNQLQTAAGKAVWLQGLCVDSLEWSAAGEHMQESIPVAIEQWKANVIRLPVNEEFWFGRNKWQKDNGMGYRKTVDAIVDAAASRGAYVALDLHSFGAPLDKHAAFWKDAATRYKNHPAVLFELFNEPHGISWSIWRDGGPLNNPGKKTTDVNAAENTEAMTGDKSPGMQALVDAVRGAGAQNIVIAGGLDWGYDLSGVARDYALAERSGGRGIVYSSHIYPWKKDWQGKVLAAAAKYPIFIGEVGCPKQWEDFSFIPPGARQEKLGPGCTWPGDMIGLIQKHKLNWTGFSFHPKCGPMVISDWDYTPTPYWGAFVKDALAGKTFEMERMR